MRESRGFNVGGVRKTRILFTEDRSELFPYLETLGKDSFVIIEKEASGLFPDHSLPRKCMIADWPAEQTDMGCVMNVLETARNLEVKPGDRWIVFGNGPVIDVGSFAALLYFGGAPLTLVPTTLFSMTDGAIGGRCGISYPGERDLCHTSYPADEVIIDIDLLSFQRELELRNGFGGIVRMALLDRDGRLLDFLIEHSGDIRSVDSISLMHIVERSIGVKLDYIERDPEGKAEAQALELGNRFAYGLSLDEDSRASHGNSVIWGMGMAVSFGMMHGITDPEFARRVNTLIRRYNFDMTYRMTRHTVSRYRESWFCDAATGNLDMIVPRGQGDCVLVSTAIGNLFKLLS